MLFLPRPTTWWFTSDATQVKSHIRVPHVAQSLLSLAHTVIIYVFILDSSRLFVNSVSAAFHDDTAWPFISEWRNVCLLVCVYACECVCVCVCVSVRTCTCVCIYKMHADMCVHVSVCTQMICVCVCVCVCVCLRERARKRDVFPGWLSVLVVVFFFSAVLLSFA